MLDLLEKRRKAEAWVNGYVTSGVLGVGITALIPGTATAWLCTIEATMCYQIGKIYGHNFTMAEATVIAGVVGIAAFTGQIVAMESAIIAGPFAIILKPLIAAGIIKAMGQLVIKHYEDCG